MLTSGIKYFVYFNQWFEFSMFTLNLRNAMLFRSKGLTPANAPTKGLIPDLNFILIFSKIHDLRSCSTELQIASYFFLTPALNYSIKRGKTLLRKA